MRETNFVRQNKEKWLQSEQLIKGDEKDPEKLSTLFVQVVDDLSYSQTYYKYRSVRVYLNTIAREFFSIISDSKKEKKNLFKAFWLDELPQIIIHCKKELLISLIVFLFSIAIGVFSSANDKDFTASILGDRYVAMTLENMKKGDPMAVYKEGNQVDMFLEITYNNLMVASKTYVFGIFMSIGTIVILLSNGIMLGSFQYFFVQHDLLSYSSMTIWLHGTLEISAIVIAGGAGITLGSGLLFPGTYSRIQAFQMSAVRSLKLLMGIAPIIVTAGIIESFLTRYTEVPSFIKLSLIFLCAAFIIGYFIVYPWRKSKTGFINPLKETKIQPTITRKLDFNRVKNNADILSDAFNFYKRNFNSLIKWVIPLSLGNTLIYFLLHEEGPQRGEWTFWDLILYIFQEMFFAISFASPELVLLGAITTSLIIYRVFIALLSEQGEKINYRKQLTGLLLNFVLTALLYLFLYWAAFWGGLIVILVYVIITLFIFGIFKQHPLAQVWNYVTSGFSQLMGLQFILFLTLAVFLAILTSPILYFYTQTITWNFTQSNWIKDLMLIVETFIKFFAFYALLPIVACSVGLLYSSLREVTTASNLKLAISQIHMKRLKRGIENEE